MATYNDIKQNLNINVDKHLNDGFAHLTHYWQNHGNGVSRYFLPFAKEYLQKEILSVAEEPQQLYIPISFDVPFPPPENPTFKFVDLFAGIGGFRLAFQNLGGKCVFSSEWNNFAKKTYERNFGEMPFGDITQISETSIPDHDVLCAGFPCQPFSISGKMKGFEDTRGTLIYPVFRIIEKTQPKVVFLENVKHLIHHDKGRTLSTIVQHLEELGYQTSKKVLNASDFGLPQNRERILVVGHKTHEFDFSKIKTQPKTALKCFLDEDNAFEYMNEPYTILEKQKQQPSGLIFSGYRNKKTRKKGVREGTEHLSRVHKQPNRIYSSEGIHPTIPSQESSGRFWIWHNEKVRKLTIQECYRIMGFPKAFKFVSPKSELYKQIGNSVAIPMIEAVAEEIKTQLLVDGISKNSFFSSTKSFRKDFKRDFKSLF